MPFKRSLATTVAGLVLVFGCLIGGCTVPPPQRALSPTPAAAPAPRLSRDQESPTAPVPVAEPEAPAEPKEALPAEPESEPEPAEDPETLHAFNQPLPAQALPEDAPAMKHANLSPAACRQEVARRKLPVKRDRRPTPGVATALRFTGPLEGVRFVTAGWKSPFGVMDCRLVLAFEAMTEVLREHGVVQVNVGTIYRNGSKLRSRKLSQHAHALAADILGFELEDGRKLVMERDFSGEIGQPPCGPESRLRESTDQSIVLRDIICDLARHQLFHYMLTPNYDRAHHDHLHVDIVRGGRRGVIR